MKFRLTFKTPDVMYYALQDIPEEQREACEEAAGKYVKHDEYITVEIDTETEKATVVPVK